MSDGLTAVYQFETSINIANATSSGGDGDPGGRVSYVGLSGGFGTLTAGHLWSASFNNVGVIVDNSIWNGATEVTARTSNTVSYAASAGNASFQVDLSANNGWGEGSVMAKPAVGNTPAVMAQAEDKDIDASQIGATLQLSENAKIAFAHINYDQNENMDQERKQSVIAGQYTVGGMTMYLGFGQTKSENGMAADDTAVAERKDKTTYFGVHGGVGDTGLYYLFQVRNKKASGELGDGSALTDGNVQDITGLGSGQVSKYNPWFFSLRRNLGGNTTVALEHVNHDQDNVKSDTFLFLKVDF